MIYWYILTVFSRKAIILNLVTSMSSHQENIRHLHIKVKKLSFCRKINRNEMKIAEHLKYFLPSLLFSASIGMQLLLGDCSSKQNNAKCYHKCGYRAKSVSNSSISLLIVSNLPNYPLWWIKTEYMKPKLTWFPCRGWTRRRRFLLCSSSSLSCSSSNWCSSQF